MLKEGKRPDYRYSLANERTFLAWVRTALAFLAGAVGLDLLAANIEEAMYTHMLSMLLATAALCLALFSFTRWLRNERAMRLDKDLPYTGVLKLVSITIIIAALITLYIMNYEL